MDLNPFTLRSQEALQNEIQDGDKVLIDLQDSHLQMLNPTHAYGK